MYKKTAKANDRKQLKSNNYMPSLNTISERGVGGLFYKKQVKKKFKQKDKTKIWFGIDISK